MPVDLKSQSVFDALLAYVAGEGGHNARGKTAQQIVAEARAEGADAAEATRRLIYAGFSMNYPGTWLGFRDKILGGASLWGHAQGRPAPRAAVTVIPSRAVGKAAAAPAKTAARSPRRPDTRPFVSALPILTTVATSAVTPASAAPAVAPGAAMPSVDGWAAEYRASPTLQREYLTESSYVAARRHDARRAGQRFNPHSAAEADQQTDPHVAEWMRSPALQAEFVTAASYSALKRAEAAGRFRTAGSRGRQ